MRTGHTGQILCFCCGSCGRGIAVYLKTYCAIMFWCSGEAVVGIHFAVASYFMQQMVVVCFGLCTYLESVAAVAMPDTTETQFTGVDLSQPDIRIGC